MEARCPDDWSSGDCTREGGGRRTVAVFVRMLGKLCVRSDHCILLDDAL